MPVIKNTQNRRRQGIGDIGGTFNTGQRLFEHNERVEATANSQKNLYNRYIQGNGGKIARTVLAKVLTSGVNVFLPGAGGLVNKAFNKYEEHVDGQARRKKVIDQNNAAMEHGQKLESMKAREFVGRALSQHEHDPRQFRDVMQNYYMHGDMAQDDVRSRRISGPDPRHLNVDDLLAVGPRRRNMSQDALNVDDIVANPPGARQRESVKADIKHIASKKVASTQEKPNPHSTFKYYMVVRK